MLPLREVRARGIEGVEKGWLGFDLGRAAERSDTGGEGGVGVSDTPDEDVFAGGVSNEVSVVVGDSSERGEAETATGSMLR